MITGIDVWTQYLDELDVLFHELVQARWQDDEAAVVEVLTAINLLAESYVEKSDMILALEERVAIEQLGFSSNH